MARRVVVINGDGTGPELAEAAIRVISSLQPDIEVARREAGYEWWISAGRPSLPSLIPPETWDAILDSDACLKAPTTTPPDPRAPASVAVSIRRRMDLYANLRPIRTFKGRVGPLGEVDFLCVREATEGLYIGAEAQLDDDTAIAIRKITRRGSERVARVAFNEAAKRGYGRVVAITKRNILRLTDTFFWEGVEKVSKEFPGIALEEYFIDNMAQQLVKNPQRFNKTVLLSTNLFMDVISELCSALIGNIGLVYSANLGDRYAMFEPAHGSAPKYKGLYRVNPTAMILSAAWMLDYLGFPRHAKSIFAAAEEVIGEGKAVTYDLGGSATTLEMADAIAKRALEVFDTL